MRSVVVLQVLKCFLQFLQDELGLCIISSATIDLFFVFTIRLVV